MPSGSLHMFACVTRVILHCEGCCLTSYSLAYRQITSGSTSYDVLPEMRLAQAPTGCAAAQSVNASTGHSRWQIIVPARCRKLFNRCDHMVSAVPLSYYIGYWHLSHAFARQFPDTSVYLSMSTLKEAVRPDY